MIYHSRMWIHEDSRLLDGITDFEKIVWNILMWYMEKLAGTPVS